MSLNNLFNALVNSGRHSGRSCPSKKALHKPYRQLATVHPGSYISDSAICHDHAPPDLVMSLNNLSNLERHSEAIPI
ncbi:uncharacterized protein EI90DRAFT_3132488 [Cantharellus anzutake]|uniref:uncharacterized protein n=1 Tax=Cantharellus anzutake TaxID=1750568 RepID=UPI0019055824|nr:uncharacterized protein EI90DRAFT_3132488 [Cantharellus anzutake]KAF8319593.1 hypothetical protein EI90DRAFT_3132488 [Cantharellus anzutake]